MASGWSQEYFEKGTSEITQPHAFGYKTGKKHTGFH